MTERKGVILLSGGLDSATTAAIAKDEGYLLHALTFSYGQRHELEISFAKSIVDFLEIPVHHVIQLPDILFSNTALKKNSELDVPGGGDLPGRKDIPVTYVPARNIVFLSLALAYAESNQAGAIFAGVNAVDYSGYPDCRPEFINTFQEMVDAGTRTGVEGKSIVIKVPLITMEKSSIIRRGHQLGFDYSLTHSCYNPHTDGSSCGVCDSCIIRRRGFEEAGIPDPTMYRK